MLVAFTLFLLSVISSQKSFTRLFFYKRYDTHQYEPDSTHQIKKEIPFFPQSKIYSNNGERTFVPFFFLNSELAREREKKGVVSGEWFRSTDLRVMSPPRFPCATPLSSHKRHPSRSLCPKDISCWTGRLLSFRLFPKVHWSEGYSMYLGEQRQHTSLLCPLFSC